MNWGGFYLDVVAEDTVREICKSYNLLYKFIDVRISFSANSRSISINIDRTDVCNHTITNDFIKIITQNDYENLIWGLVSPKVEEMREEQLILELAGIK